MRGRPKENLLVRFEKHFVKTNGCWEWLGSRGCGGRYGRFGFNGRNALAHRVSYIIYRSEVPLGMSICHSCDNGLCVNPGHLWIGTHAENMKDKEIKGGLLRSYALLL